MRLIQTTAKSGLVSALGLLAFVVTLNACQQAQQVTSMHDATKDIREETRQMNAQMGKVEKTTDSMAELTRALGLKIDAMTDLANDAVRVARQGISMELRRQLLKDMHQAPNQASKISLAAKYFMAFEYQFWSGRGAETEAARLDLAANAAQEFMLDIEQFLRPGQNETQPAASPEMAAMMKRFYEDEAANAGERSPEEKRQALIEQQNMFNLIAQDGSVNALSAALFKLNPVQEALLKRTTKDGDKPLPPVSMLTMLEDAIQAESQIESGTKRLSDFPQYVHEILQGQKKAVLLLQARHQAYSFLALTRLSKFLMSEEEKTKMSTGPWPLGLADLNTQEIREVVTFLRQTRDGMEFLKKNGIEPKVSSTFANIWKNAQLTPDLEAIKSQGRASAVQGDRGDVMLELVNLLDLVRK